MPAIMKGWIDRVLAPGFGFNPITNNAYDTGLFKGKSAILVTTTGSPKEGARRPEQTSRIHNSLRL